MKQVTIKVTGIQPLMLHNVQTADPMNKWSKKLKEVTSQKDKNDENQLKIIEIQFYAAWYIDEDGHYVLPSDNVLMSFYSGAKEFKKGQKFIENVQIVEDNLIIQFDGMDKSLEQLFDGGCGKNVDTRLCGISSGIGGKKKVTATRAFIDKWSVSLTILYDETQISLDDIKRAAEIAGLRKGVGTYRRKYGRYKVDFSKK